ncbi:MAG: AAA family ATPase, partial [Gemmatimonadota bacterium]|nr:AAA family ATPase [Gemmatimonadota bacterium]
AQAHTYATAGRLTYAPLIAWLRTPALKQRLAQLRDPDLTELARLMPEVLNERVGVASPTPMTESWQRLRLFEALMRAVLAEHQPLILMLDDLQWCDQETLDWLHFLLRHDSSAPLLVLVTVRSEDVGAGALRPWWLGLERDEQATVIELSALNVRETLALAQQLSAGALGAEQAAPLYRYTEGNPLFVVELVRMELHRSRASPTAAPLAVMPDSPAVLPARMHAVLQTRLAQLSPAARALAHLAATIGRAFSVAVLIQGSDEDEHTVVAALDELWRRQIIREQRVNSYDFSHDKLRDVAYQELSPIQRRVLHGRVARALEVIDAENLEPLSAQLAAHFEQAGLPREALGYYERAALGAQRMSAHREAVAYFEQALTILSFLPKSRRLIEQAIDLRLALRHSLLPLGEFGHTVVHLREAEKLAALLDDQRRLGWVSAYLAPSLHNMGDYHDALQAGQRALATGDAIAGSALEMMASFFISLAHLHLGNYRDAAAYLRRNIEALEGELARQRFGEPILPYVANRVYLAWCLAERGEFAEGFARGKEAVAVAEAEAVDEPFTTTHVSFGVGLLHLRKGELAEAIVVLERCIHISETADVPMMFAYAAHFLGLAYALVGRVTEGLGLLERAAEQATSIGIGALHALRIAHLGEAYLLAGQIDAAMASATRAIELARYHDERGSAAWTLRLLGEIHSRCDPPDVVVAEDYYIQAEALAAELGMHPLVAHCHLSRGRLYQREARWERAHDHLTTAMAMYREMGMRYWLEQVEVEIRGLA